VSRESCFLVLFFSFFSKPFLFNHDANELKLKKRLLLPLPQINIINDFVMLLLLDYRKKTALLDYRKKTALFEPFIYKMHQFTKTGSGQT
jgi:hypothetical protein